MVSKIQINNSSVDVRCIYMTLVALYVLKEVFKRNKNEWQLIAQKAKEFLKNNGVEKPDNVVKKFSLKLKK